MQELYPLSFQTIYKDKIWGGKKVKSILGKNYGALPNCGETWEISGVTGNVSIVKGRELAGNHLNDLILKFGARLMGEKIIARFGNEFPLLIKFLDAAEDLSIQVHPDDELAKKRHNGFGKTEMWYVLQADEGATLISGFNRPLDKQTYLEYFNHGKLPEILNQEKVTAGDVFFLPAGRVHTIGKGLMIAEIQQTSDITYRIYDFDRVDEKGNKRELHVEQALEAIDFKQYPTYKTSYREQPNSRNQLVTCPFFTTNKIQFDEAFEASLPNLDCFKIYICLEGKVTLSANNYNHAAFGKGDVILVPAIMKNYQFETNGSATLLETYIE
jgi:mannose-6-phosphate isomerase